MPASMHTTRRPNVVLFLADDLGYRDIGCYGNTVTRTPNIDSLAHEGVRFTAFYANAPECSPTRAALLTGRYQQRVGGLECAIGSGNVGRYDEAMRLRESNDLGLPVEEISIARMLKDAGYATAICGKWHLGYEPKFSPNRHGFDYAFYLAGGGVDYFHHVEPPPSDMPTLHLNEKPIQREGYLTDLIAQESTDFIGRQRADQPFFLYVPFTAPHTPFQGPDDRLPESLPKDSPLWKQGNAPKEVYRAMIESMDEAVGSVLRQLDEKGMADNTLVIFMSDNGGTGSADSGPWQGGKGRVLEGGIRVPCVAKWPGHLKPGVVSDQPCLTMDFSSSILGSAGTNPPADRPLDGEDILKLIEEGRTMERTLFWRARRENRTEKAVRDGSLKYIYEDRQGQKAEYLYDLDQDPGETTNLFTSQPADVERMKALFHNWEIQVKHTRGTLQ